MTVKIRAELLKNNELVLAKVWKDPAYSTYTNIKILKMIQTELNVSDDMVFNLRSFKNGHAELTTSDLIRVVNGICSSLLSKECIYEVRVFVDDNEVPLE